MRGLAFFQGDFKLFASPADTASCNLIRAIAEGAQRWLGFEALLSL